MHECLLWLTLAAYAVHVLEEVTLNWKKWAIHCVITATLLFMPISIWIYYGAYLDGILTGYVGVISFILGGLLMASPIVFLKLRPKLMDHGV